MRAEKLKNFLAPLPFLGVIILYLLYPARYAIITRSGISLWAVSVLPTAFPFLLCSTVLSESKAFEKFIRFCSPFFEKLFSLSGEGGSCMLFGLVCGYPVGAKMTANALAQGKISEEEALSVATLSSFCSPVFAVGVVGGFFQSPRLGFLLYFSHLAGVFLVGLARRKAVQAPARKLSARPTEKTKTEPMLQTALTMLCVGGYIAFYYLLGQMCEDLRLFSLPVLLLGERGEILSRFLRGILEMTGGCYLLSAEKSPLSLSLCCFLITFGGICVLAQQFSFLKKTAVKRAEFVKIKLLQALISSVVCYVLALYLF